MVDIAPEVRAAYTRGDMGNFQYQMDSTGNFRVYMPPGTDPSTLSLKIAAVPRRLNANEVDPNGIVKNVSRPLSSNGYPTQVAAPSPASTPAVKDRRYLRKVAEGDSVVRTWRKGRYVETPREMLRKAGINKGDYISLEKTSDGRHKVTVVPDVAGSRFTVQSSRHCLRMHKTVLNEYGVGSSSGVVFTFENGSIYIS